MRTLLMAFLFCLTSSIVNAQSVEVKKTVVCDNTQAVIKSLMEQYKEKPMWVARNPLEDARYALFINSEKGTWTLLQMNTEIACVIGVGSESRLLIPSL